jgi:hypothetical protein
MMRRPCIVLVAAILAGCAQNSAALPPAAQSDVRSAATPPRCLDQRTTKKFGARTITLKKAGGSLCVPEFGGFGGSIGYPKVEAGVALTARTSTQDIYDEPQLGSGTSLVYVNLHFHAGTHFGSTLKVAGALTSASFTSGQPYTAFGIVAVGHLVLMFPPCYVVATSGAYGGVLSNVGEMLTNTTITGNGFGVIEIYSGMQASNQC